MNVIYCITRIGIAGAAPIVIRRPGRRPANGGACRIRIHLLACEILLLMGGSSLFWSGIVFFFLLIFNRLWRRAGTLGTRRRGILDGPRLKCARAFKGGYFASSGSICQGHVPPDTRARCWGGFARGICIVRRQGRIWSPSLQ